MEDKIGVFICTGYGIAEALDVDALLKVATDENKVPFSRTVDSCEGPGLESINEDIKSEGLTKAVIAGISPRNYKEGLFPEGVIVEKVALREHIVWCQPPGEEDERRRRGQRLNPVEQRVLRVPSNTVLCSLEHEIAIAELDESHD